MSIRILFLLVTYFFSFNGLAIDVYHSLVDVHQSPDVRAVVLSSYGQYEVTEIRVGQKVLGKYHVSKRSNCHLANHINAQIETAKSRGRLIRFKFADGISYGSCAGALSDGISLRYNPNPVRVVAGLDELEAQLNFCQEQVRALTDTSVGMNRGFEDDLIRRVKEMGAGTRSGSNTYDVK